MVVLEVVAESSGGHQTLRKGNIRAGVQGDVGSGIADVVRIVGNRVSSSWIWNARCRVLTRQGFTGLALALIEVRTEDANLVRNLGVDAPVGIEGVGVLAEGGGANASKVNRLLE